MSPSGRTIGPPNWLDCRTSNAVRTLETRRRDGQYTCPRSDWMVKNPATCKSHPGLHTVTSAGFLRCLNQARAPLKIRSLARTFPATYVVFDLLYQRFASLLALPLRARRRRLETVVRACTNPRLVFSEGI